MWGDWYTDNPNTLTQDEKEKLINQAKLIAGIAAAYAGEDINVAADMAAEAVRWNAASAAAQARGPSNRRQQECAELGYQLPTVVNIMVRKTLKPSDK